MISDSDVQCVTHCVLLNVLKRSVILTRIPWNRDKALSGLSARSVRIVLKAWILPAPNQLATKLTIETYGSVRRQSGHSLMAPSKPA